MYSDMSIRTIACSESNMNSASDRASSVLPTPVGPMNRKVPIGWSGSWSPARERRRALDTASTASSWPTTRSCRRSSMCTSLATSDSSSRDTGICVQRATTSATSSSSTSSLRKVRSDCSSRSRASVSLTFSARARDPRDPRAQRWVAVVARQRAVVEVAPKAGQGLLEPGRGQDLAEAVEELRGPPSGGVHRRDVLLEVVLPRGAEQRQLRERSRGGVPSRDLDAEVVGLQLLQAAQRPGEREVDLGVRLEDPSDDRPFAEPAQDPGDRLPPAVGDAAERGVPAAVVAELVGQDRPDLQLAEAHQDGRTEVEARRPRRARASGSAPRPRR